MNLAIFDIDGTLTETSDVDTECFVQAFADAHAITKINTNWIEYPHATDSSISLQIFKEKFGRSPNESELLKFKNSFVRLLEKKYSEDSSLFAEVVGASSLLARLSKETEWKIAIATGGWRKSAELKLKNSGINIAEFPSAFAEDGLSREEILQSALSKSIKAYGQNDFYKIVSIGDGLWDVHTAYNLKLSFLGIGNNERKQMLCEAGTTHVINNFADYDYFIQCLKNAEIPKIQGFNN
jgi:phosphoglycolate phosphatase-like HAD superfamily hydrolase